MYLFEMVKEHLFDIFFYFEGDWGGAEGAWREVECLFTYNWFKWEKHFYCMLQCICM